MAKLNALKLFDVALLKGSRAAQEMGPFIEFVNQNFDSILRAMRGQLTLDENIKSQTLSVSLRHGQETTLALANTSVLGAVPVLVRHASDGLESFNLSQTSKGAWRIVPYFREASSEVRDVTLVILFR